VVSLELRSRRYLFLYMKREDDDGAFQGENRSLEKPICPAGEPL
jgi:hypothetical protein